MFTSERAKILLETAHHLHTIRLKQRDRGVAEGVQIAVKELKRLASVAHEEHKQNEAKLRQQRRDSNANAKAFGY